MKPPSANELYRAAQMLIRSGQPVFPCKARGSRAKAPLTKNGFLDASLDKDRIKRWLKSDPNLALGIPTGVVWDVLDVDVKRDNDGRSHLSSLTDLGLLNGCKFVVRTPSGGWHLYFKAAKGLTNTAHAALGLDVRAKGGYVLASPSYIETDEYSGVYERVGETIESTDDPLLWDLIINTLAPVNEDTHKPIALLAYERRSSLGALRGWLSERRTGERNHALYWAVCRCIENGIDPNELLEVALHIGLEERESQLTINSALRRAGVDVEDLDSEAEAMFSQ